jgi:menaquinone-dependent protoporphyrinogen oxidase
VRGIVTRRQEMQKILIAVASKHGATTDIGAEIGRTLADAGMSVEVSPPEEVASIEPFDAVVIGSAVYAGHWQSEAREFIDRFSADLKRKPVWLFSSGPIGDPPKPEADPVDIADYVAWTGARAHEVFAGSLDKEALSLPERAIARALRAPFGDFREWDAIHAWAEEIAAELAPAPH